MDVDPYVMANGIIAIIFGVPSYQPFMMEGIAKKHQELCLAGIGDTDNFINKSIVDVGASSNVKAILYHPKMCLVMVSV